MSAVTVCVVFGFVAALLVLRVLGRGAPVAPTSAAVLPVRVPAETARPAMMNE
ncbi:hypothetical protein ACWEVD_30615 [Nocardia thailandica]